VLKVIVVEIKGGTVRLGFEVDAAVPVHRSEVWARIHGTPEPCGRAANRSTEDVQGIEVAGAS
jgi:sRNA-binding carbon storage regulator CsrA